MRRSRRKRLKAAQKLIENVPFARIFPPTAVPLAGSTENAKVPETAVSVKEVMVTVPLP